MSLTSTRAMRRPSPDFSYPSANVKAEKTSHTVELDQPVNIHLMASSGALNFGFANSFAPNSTQGASAATIAEPISPVAAKGNDSTISAVMVPAKMAKKYHACCSRPVGVG